MNLWQRIISAPRTAFAAAVRNVVSSDREGMLALFGQGSLSSADEPINDFTAMRVSTVYACLTKMAGVISQLPIHHYRLDENGDRVRIMNTPLWWWLNESPEARWTAANWKEWIVRCVMLRGDQFTQILRAGPNIAGFRVLSPDQVIVRMVDGRLRYYISWVNGIDASVEYYAVDQDDMLHFTGFGFNGVYSQSVIQHAAFNAIGNSLAAAKYTGKSLASGGMPQIALRYPNKFDVKQADQLRDSFSKTYGGNNTGGKVPLVLAEGAEVKELTLSAVDLEIIAQRRFEKEDICQAFGVPPVLIGENDKTSSWGTGIEQIMLGFIKLTIMPMVTRWEEELNRKLFRRAGQFVEASFEAMLRGDSKSQSEAFRAAVGGPGTGDGWLSVNEIRKLQNRPGLGPDFDKPYRAQRDTASTGATP